MEGTQMHQILFSFFIIVLCFNTIHFPTYLQCRDIICRNGSFFSLLTFLSSHSRCEAHRVLTCSLSIFPKPRSIQGSRTSWYWSVGSMDEKLQGGLSASAPMLLAKERALELRQFQLLLERSVYAFYFLYMAL
jgi:hypothetical protein